MKRLNTKGFTIVEGLLILVLAIVIVGAGWYVSHRQSENKKQAAIASFADCKADKDSRIQESFPEVCVTKNGKHFTNPQQDSESANWLAYQPPGKQFKVKIADGWNLTSYTQGDFVALSTDSNKLAIKQGTKAKVVATNGDESPTTGMTISYTTSGPVLPNGQKTAAIFKTYEGKDVDQYYYVLPRTTAGSDVPEGAKVYYYWIKGTKGYVYIGYAAAKDETNYVKNVEKVVKTVELP